MALISEADGTTIRALRLYWTVALDLSDAQLDRALRGLRRSQMVYLAREPDDAHVWTVPS